MIFAVRNPFGSVGGCAIEMMFVLIHGEFLYLLIS
jgi:hypothetical protein